MADIQTRIDVEKLVDAFYKQVLSDELIGPFFTDVVVLDWDVHIPIMYDFWESMLLDSGAYKRNAMLKHIALDEKKKLEDVHFDRWVSLWEHTVNDHFAGKRAALAITKARQIGALIQHKLQSLTSLE